MIKDCPNCGRCCARDEVDVGVGVMHGPWGCGGCGWSEDPYYDSSNAEDGLSPSGREHPDFQVDSRGGLQRKSVAGR